MITKPVFVPAAVIILSGFYVYGASVNNSSGKAVPGLIRALDLRSLPSDAPSHHRTKWSNDALLYINDDAAAPQVYVFDRSGKVKMSGMIQIPDADRIRLDDYAAAPDGGVWTAGHALSKTGQQSFLIARIAPDGLDVHIVETTPYHPRQLSVAPDGTVWTVGSSVVPDGKGRYRTELNQDILRHFDASGRQIGSAMPVSAVDRMRPVAGFLAANQDRLGWYSPPSGAGAYAEFSPDMKVLHSYPVAHIAAKKGSIAECVVLTPSERVFVMVSDYQPAGQPSRTLYELDRSANDWVPVDVARTSWLEGNDGESLIFDGPAGSSEFQVFDVSAR